MAKLSTDELLDAFAHARDDMTTGVVLFTGEGPEPDWGDHEAVVDVIVEGDGFTAGRTVSL